MAAIITRRRWTRPPSGLVQPDWSNDIANGLQALFDQQNNSELLSGAIPTSDIATRKNGIQGVAETYSGTANQQYASTSALAITGALTVAAYFDLNSLTNYSAIISKEGDPTTYMPYEIRLGRNPTDGQVDVIRAASGSFNEKYGTNSFSAPSTGNLLVVTWPNRLIQSNPSIYVNGVSQAINGGGGGGSGSTADNGASVWIGRRSNGATQLDGKLYWVGLWNRALDVSEVSGLWTNPWQLFAKRTRRLYFGITSGTNFSGTPGLGSLIRTGRGAVSPGPVLVIGYNFAPVVGSAVEPD